MLKPLMISLLILFAAPTTAASETSGQTIYVVRHMEKAEGDDPPLSAGGTVQAGKLADLLAVSAVKAVFASPTRRAMQTAEPLARRLGLAVTPYDPRNPATMVEQARTVPGDVLVVGHSNTVPDLVARFGGPQPAALGERDYGTVFRVRHGKVEAIPLSPAAPVARANQAPVDQPECCG